MKTFVLIAGGTGGHLFPAMALAQELIRRGHAVELMTDHRVESYGADFPARRIHIVPAATPSGRNPLKLVGAGMTIVRGIGTAWNVLRKLRPDAVIGFGGYPTFPPFVAANLLGIPGVLHEQNAVMGRANRALVRFADVLAMSFPETRFAENQTLEKVVTGNPVRDRVRPLAAKPYPALDQKGAIRLVVTGGSQGGGITLAASALVPDVAVAMPDVPFLCHFRRTVGHTDDHPYQEIVRFLATHRDHAAQVFETLDYFDGLNFAPRIQARTLVSTALMDTICPPSSVYAVYNHMNCERQIRVYDFNGHEGGGIHHAVEKVRFLNSIWPR